MFYLEVKEKVPAKIKDIYGFEEKTVEKERWRAIANSEIREDMEALHRSFGPRVRKKYRITEVET